MQYRNDASFAREADRDDPLREFRKQYLFPSLNRKPALYFTGNSLGLQPRSVAKSVQQELKDWARLGVEGHVHAKRPWLYYHHFSRRSLARLTGARPSEVVAMNQLTVNLHLLMVSFYRPTKSRFKILIEDGAFPSDRYAVDSQARFHGFNPSDAIIALKPRPGEDLLRDEDIDSAISAHGNELALVLFGAVQYYTGQFFNIRRITEAAHRAGAIAGFDLAHTIGNVPLQLHNDGADFAAWCGYKYLNSGPGGMAGIFVHERHAGTDVPRFEGWWGHSEKRRFLMEDRFVPMEGADAWQLSNFPILPGAAQLAALELFDQAGMKALRRKSIRLTGYLEFLLKGLPSFGKRFDIITPDKPASRGCQLSIRVFSNGKKVFDRLTSAGIIADWREPAVIRVAPVPMYNSFTDVWKFVKVFGDTPGIKNV